MNKVKYKQTIKLLEKMFGIKLSPEQIKVIAYNHKSPVLVNSCAGAGKTTLLMFDIFLLILTHQAKPSNIIGITFSRDARKNMQVKYRNIKNKLALNGHFIKSASNPSFRTFHSLFYHLLRCSSKYKHAKVVGGYTNFKFLLERALMFPNIAMSKSEQLKYIFQEYDQLINSNYTYDGIHINNQKQADKLLHNGWMIKDLTVNPYAKTNHSKTNVKRTVNYIRAIKGYRALKHKKNMIDFNDMKVLLLKALSKQRMQTKISKVMGKIKYCFIDEYQDIDNLQNLLMDRLLTKTAKSNLSVIGDDDQSIYSFRGSNPNLIINYLKNHKSAHRFQLSTNYRTNNKVLAGVRPLIDNNKFRIDKSLKSANFSRGGLFSIHKTLDDTLKKNKHLPQSSGLVLLQTALIKLHNLASNQTIAILTRFNTDKMIATDYLANKHILVKPSKLIQNDRIYKIYSHIINALLFDNINCLKGYLKKIGFITYEKHFRLLSKMIGIDKGMKLSQLLKSVIKFDKQHLPSDNDNFRIDKDLLNDIKSVHSDHSGSNAIGLATKLTIDYFQYMTKHNFMSRETWNEIRSYLYEEVGSYRNVRNWVSTEIRKLKAIKRAKRTRRYNKRIFVMTIHQSKGLQFNYVFLYNLSDRNLSDGEVNVDKDYHPNLTKQQFMEDTLKLNKEKLDDLDGLSSRVGDLDTDRNGFFDYYDDLAKKHKVLNVYTNLVHGLKLIEKNNKLAAKHIHKKNKKNKIGKITKKLNQNMFKDLVNNALGGNKDTDQLDKLWNTTQDLFNEKYIDTKQICSFVEEERRLVYVAITRAKVSAIYNVTKHPNPLLYELALDKHNILCLNKKGELVPSIQDKETKNRSIDNKIAKLKELKAELNK